nr:uncharacterized protein LOC102449186 isoform X1 [Pelodiscus sinensis]XP_006117711.1 uncharacterized protein LOC102449186 isoform X3 [Pelodiscus sinensis]XP_025037725.1 uncharacterized protein LOC102449186 isoform X2 [Pelodiscus sinensis]|eukprot:XP_006117710.1 uncharacterized protein LOC102449186 isoform X1 [Pelodiscus sinensis]
MAKDFPSVEEDPVKFKAELALVIRSYDPNWQDLDLLLRVILPDDKRKKILKKAGWPPGPISGDPDLAANKEALTRARNGLLDSILQVFPKLPNWAKISTCKQEENESPGAYLERLTKVFERHSGIENPADTAKQALGAAFVTGLDPAIQTLLKQITIGWETKPLEELLTVANHCRQCIKAKQDKEPKLMVLQSLPTKTGRGRGRPIERQSRGSPWSGNSAGRGNPRINANTCHYCKQPGHWKSQCPNRPMQPEPVAFRPPQGQFTLATAESQ